MARRSDRNKPQTAAADSAAPTLIAPPVLDEITGSLVVDPEPALVAGRYEILGLLGVGGMGRVYRARDRELGELVALKVLQVDALDDPVALDRFRREARLARQVTHRNVVRIFDLGDDGGRKFLTMELVDGESLASLLERDGALPVGRALDLAADVCAGLAAAHAVGVVHRDLKPANVLLARDGRVLLTDFGIATSRAEAAQSVLTGDLLLGTPDYMAPEQVEGSSEVDARADVFAMGAMLHEMLAGAPPWSAATAMATALARLLAPAPDLRALRADLPDALAEAVSRCLARKPDDRFESVVALARALAAVRPPTREIPAPAGARASWPPVEFGVAKPGIKTVAVLPLRNAGRPDDVYVAEGLAEDLADTLSMTPGLRLRASGAVRRVASTQRDPIAAGRELGVQVVVDGSIRRIDRGMRIAVRAIGVADGFQLWARRFDRDGADLLVATDEIARAIAGALATEVGAPERSAAPDAEAIDLYLRGRQQYRLRFAPNAAQQAVDLLDKAVARMPDDPTFQSAYTVALVRLGWFALDDEPLRVRAAEIAERTVARAPHLADPWLARGMVRQHSGEIADAVRDFRVALQRNPAFAEAYEQLGTILCEAGLVDEGLRLLETALELDPTNEAPLAWMAQVHVLLGNVETNRRLLDRIGGPGYLPIRAIAAARACLYERDAKTAQHLLDAMGKSDGNELMRGARTILCWVAGGAAGPLQVESVRRMARSTGPRRRAALAHQLAAEIAAFAEGPDAALAEVEAATEAGLIDLTWMDRARPLDGLRDDPRFAELRARVADAAKAVVDAYRVS